ncbi:tRNA (guanosine(37)-N1)-methyltransferase TrmD [Alicyclobacillaceae bacterium I2511]|nr:tRNA (guanosine(37)-N1)-methyltransferase TrmD [Alicyclobacillaceae bacterium I2511]
MRITVLSLFPEMFRGMLEESIVKRSIQQGLVQVELSNFRDFSEDRHHTVDDYPFGGGAGMVLKPAPLFRAVAEALDSEDERQSEAVVLMTPQGRPFRQNIAEYYARKDHIILICGHYEGIDERVRQQIVTDEISLGDFVLTGGEIAAMAVMDAVIRLLPGVLGNTLSAAEDSFAKGLLEYPQYTRPANFFGLEVPGVLLSGHHQQVEVWRAKQALYRTWIRRPDLISIAALNPKQASWVQAWEAGDFSNIDVLEPEHVKRWKDTSNYGSKS